MPAVRFRDVLQFTEMPPIAGLPGFGGKRATVSPPRGGLEIVTFISACSMRRWQARIARHLSPSAMTGGLCRFFAGTKSGHGRRGTVSVPRNTRLSSTGNCSRTTARSLSPPAVPAIRLSMQRYSPARRHRSRAWGVTVGAPGPKALAAALDDAMSDAMKRFGVRSAALAVAKRGEILVSRGYTWAEAGFPITQPTALFRQASVSKLFSSAAAQALHDDKIVALDSSMFGFLGTHTTLPTGGAVDTRIATVTLRQAATRTTGMRRDLFGHRPDGSTGDATMRDVALLAGRPGAPTQDDLVRYIYGMPLVTDPGSMIGDGYSNIAVFVLGAVVQQAAGQPIDAYIRKRLLSPLGVSDLFVARTAVGQQLPGEVSHYDSVNAGPSMLDTSNIWAPGAYGGSFALEPAPAAGGFATSVTTVARFIGSHAVWDLGPRAEATRYGDFEGTATIAQSRNSGLDLAVAFNFWVPDDAKTKLLDRIGSSLDAAGL